MAGKNKKRQLLLGQSRASTEEQKIKEQERQSADHGAVLGGEGEALRTEAEGITPCWG